MGLKENDTSALRSAVSLNDSQLIHHRKLSGTTILATRILIDIGILLYCGRDVLNYSNKVNWIFIAMTVADILFCTSFLISPSLTCKGNTYIRCLPFLLNSYIANLLIFYINFPNFYEPKRPDRRIPFIAVFNILTLTIYGGLACPLNLAWMETIKPFSNVILINRKNCDKSKMK